MDNEKLTIARIQTDVFLKSLYDKTPKSVLYVNVIPTLM